MGVFVARGPVGGGAVKGGLRHGSWFAAMVLASSPALAQDAEPMEQYLARRVSVVDRDVTTVYAKAYDGSGRFWFVEQAGAPLDAPAFARLTGDDATADGLRRRKRAKARWGAACFVGGAGLGVLGAQLAGTSLFTSTRPEGRSDLLALTAVLPPIAGIVGGTVLLGGSFRASHPSAVYGREEAEQRARSYNEGLRTELFGEEGDASTVE